MVKFIVFIVLLGHTAFSFFALKESGYWSAFPPFADLLTTQIFSDLSIALSLVTYLIYKDRAGKHESLLPVFFVGVGAVFLGSIAPLVYFLFLNGKRRSSLLS